MNLAGYQRLEPEAYRATSAVDLGRRIAAGELSSVQLTEMALELARVAEPHLNAYVGFREDAALREAADRDAEVARGRVRSRLHGVPLAVKDNMAIAGEPMLKGSRTTSATPASASAPMVDRLVRGGGVVIGRTTTPEFGWKGTGISPLTGVTRNPWDPTRNSGGSSAGSGATVGSGAVPYATGSDAGGSIRIPAAFCGAVGFKPTLSAIPLVPGTVNESLSHLGPITRTVEDARAVFELTRGADPRDPQSAFVARTPVPPRRNLRVGIVRAPFGITPSDEVSARVEPALRLLKAGVTSGVDEVELGMPVPRDVFEALWVTGRGLGFADLIAQRRGEMDAGLARLRELGLEYSLADYLGALTRRRAFNAELFDVLSRYDVLVMPTMPITAFAADREVPEGGEADAPLPWITWTPYTYAFNITGQPAITVPVDLREGTLPVGLQIVAGWGRDDLLLDVARVFERRWARTNEDWFPGA